MRRFTRFLRLPNPRAAAVAMVMAVVAWGLTTTIHPASNFDSSIQDFALTRRTPESYLGTTANTAADPRSFITIVAIDERTLSELGAYNGGYPRTYQAQLIENLLAAPPRVIAFDIGFFEPTADDDQLAAALDHAHSLPVPTSVVLSAAGVDPVDPPAPGTPPDEHVFNRALQPIPQLSERATIALANVVPDSRGTVRNAPLLFNVGGVERPSLGLAAVAAYLRRPTYVDSQAQGSLKLAGRTVPLDSAGDMHLNFLGPPSQPYSADSTYRVVSYVDVLRGRVDPSMWRGGLVFVGTLGATGLADDYWTPLSDHGRKMAGVEIHATTAATLFSTNYVQSLSAPAELVLFVGIALLLLFTLTNLSTVASLAVGALLLLVIALGQLVALHVFGILMSVTMPLLLGLALVLRLSVPRLVREERLSHAVRAELAADRSRDRLTGLPNRGMLLARMRGMLDGKFALLVVDFDRFKDINAALGHSAGDSLLRALATRLTDASFDLNAFVARLDGDEFALLLPDAGLAEGTAMCAALVRALEAPVEVDGQTISVTAGVGIAEYPDHGIDAETLLRHADAAMHSAKNARMAYAVYVPEQEQRTAERLELVNALRGAFERDELRLHYQPKVDCRSGRVVGLEALVRWQSASLGMVAPDRFIPLAEETGLIGQLTRWVLESAVRQARAWSAAGLPLQIAVNLSSLDVQDPTLSVHILDLLRRHDVAPELLSVEITETALLADPTHPLQVLDDLANWGIDVALDDFGTGYSSLTYVRQLPARELKIDASFVKSMVESERDRAIVRSTIDLGHQLGMRVVAEGVEDGTTMALLVELGCDQVQGYYLSRPMVADSVASWVRARHSLESWRADAAA
jgi:diguanylate cyclase (GGDEF)-like protein